MTVASLVSVVCCLVLTRAALFLAGCKTPESEPLTFRYHSREVPPTLDPARAEYRWSFGVIDRLFDGLMRLDRARGVYEKELAASYTISDDGRVYEFQILPSARFHNGRSVRASDFKLAWERLLAPATDSPKAWLLEMVAGAAAYRSGAADSVDGLEVIDSHTLRIHLKRPFASFLYHLAHPATSVVPEEAVRQLGENFGHRPVGSGPYRFIAQPNEATLVLEAFDLHPRHSPRVRRLIYEAEIDFDKAVRRYQTGELDVVTQVPFGSLPALRQSFPRDLRVFPGAGWVGFCFRCDREPFHDRRVRQAFARALDRDAFVRQMGTEVRTAAIGFLPQTVPGHDPATLESGFDPERAAELLAASGHPGGAGFSLRAPTSPLFDVMKRFLASSFSQLGVELSFETVERDSNRMAGGIPFFFAVEIGDYPDPAPYLGPRFHSRGRSNDMAYANPEVDRLLEEARSQLDSTVRLDLYRQAERRIIEDAPCVALYQFNEAILLRPRWKNIPVGYDPYYLEIELAQPAEEDS